MILWLLAAHMMGDFVLSSRWQAAGKLTDRWIRLDHCVGYTAPFVLVALVYGDGWVAWYVFPVSVLALHYLTDSRRFQSTLGDWVHWRLFDPARYVTLTTHDPQVHVRGDRVKVYANYGGGETAVLTGRVVDRADDEVEAIMDLPPNPWGPLPIMVDQTLHLVQIALLASLLLR